MQVVLLGYPLDYPNAICETFTINHNGGKSVISEDVRNLALQVARALDNPDTWCQRADARDARGNCAPWTADTAVRWCAYGHAFRIGGVAAADDLARAYFLQFRMYIQSDNDKYGREYVRTRLLELANS
jgi:hypothetical protein